MKIIICSAMVKEQLDRCLNSLKNSVEQELDINILKEKEFREVTLNEAIKQNPDRDLFIVGDDIIFTKGWLECLEKNKDKGDILGFPMLYPNTNIIQDNGYDFIKIDDKISIEAKNRGKNKKDVVLSCRECDSVCGCALFIKKEVFEKIPEFSLDGQNRWGEIIFCAMAKQNRFKVVVLNHYLYHAGKSTKVNKNIKYRSISYHYEKDGWNKVVEKYMPDKIIKYKYATILSKKTLNTLEKGNILIYGIGTVSERIIKGIQNKNVWFCTGLSEEEGLVFNNKKTKYFKNLNFKKYDKIILSPLYIADEIYQTIKPMLTEKNQVYYINKKTEGKRIIYDIEKNSRADKIGIMKYRRVK